MQSCTYDSHAIVGQKFSSQADDYEKGRRPYSQEIFNLIVSKVRDRLLPSTSLQDVNALDLGSGTGISTRTLFDNGIVNVKGLEIADGMRQRAIKAAMNSEGQSVPKENYLLGNVMDIGSLFKSEQFDLVTAFSAFHWFCNIEAVNAIKTALKTNGIFVIAGGEGKTQNREKSQFWELIESIKGSPVHDPRGNYDPIKVLSECGFNVEEHRFQREDCYDFETALAKKRSFSGWCNLTEEQKISGEELLRSLVKAQIEEQNHGDGMLHRTVEELCLIAYIKV